MGKPSVISLEYKMTHSQAIRGHSNVSSSKTQIKRYNEVARAESHLEAGHIKQLHDKWRQSGGKVSSERFLEVFQQTVGSKYPLDRLEHVCKFMFQMMDTNRDQKVDWAEFCEYIVKGLREKDLVEREQENPVITCAAKFKTGHLGKIVRIIEDVGYVPAANRICLATNAREIRFHASTTGQMTHKLLIGELVLSLDVQLYESRPDACTVAVGDFKGTAFVLEFHRCSEDLFEPPPDSTLEAALRAGKPRKPAGKEKADKLAAREIRLLALPETAHSGMLIGGGSTKRPKQKPRGGRASRGFGPYVTRTILKLHSPEGDGLNEGSLQVKVVPEIESIVSVSSVTETAMVVWNYKMNQIRTFRIPKGVFSFAVDETRNMIATGGHDKILRLWNPHVPAVPIAELAGHAHSIKFVMVNPTHNQVLSCDANECIKIWHMHNQTCLNTFVHIMRDGSSKITASVTFGSKDEMYAIHAMLWNTQSQTLIAANHQDLRVLSIERDEIKALDVGMASGISAMTYADSYNMVVTGDQNGSVASWDLSSGRMVVEYVNGHMDATVTALHAGTNSRRLISADSGGQVLIWNMLSGHVLQRLMKRDPKEVNGILLSPQLERVFTVGWGGLVSCFSLPRYVDVTREAEKVLEKDWGGKQLPGEDILSVAPLGDTMMACGSFDGQLTIWDLRAAKRLKTLSMQIYLQKIQGTTLMMQASSKDSDGYVRKANSRHQAPRRSTGLPAHMPQTGVIAKNIVQRKDAIRKVLWLKRRVKLSSEHAHARAATLVTSCDGGYISFWNPLQEKILGAFYATDDISGREYVSDVETNQEENSILVTADSMGWLKIWRISKYCTDGEDPDPPSCIHRWHAHKHSISQMELIPNTSLLVTGSSDCSIRVWNLDGDYVGSFGQESGWDLHIPGKPSLGARPETSTAAPATALPPATSTITAQQQRAQAAPASVVEELGSGSGATAGETAIQTNEFTQVDEPVPSSEPQEPAGSAEESTAEPTMEDSEAQDPDSPEVTRPKERRGTEIAVNLMVQSMSNDNDTEGINIEVLPTLSEARIHAKLTGGTNKSNPFTQGRSRGKDSSAVESKLTGAVSEAGPAVNPGARPSTAVASGQRESLSVLLDGWGGARRPASAPAGVLEGARAVLEHSRERPTRLGSAYQTRKKNWAQSRIQTRDTNPPAPALADLEDVSRGMILCTPFTLLKLSSFDPDIKIRAEPSLIAHERRRNTYRSGATRALERHRLSKQGKKRLGVRAFKTSAIVGLPTEGVVQGHKLNLPVV